MQLYTANYVNDVVGKGGVVYSKHSAICCETQNYPNAINQVRPRSPPNMVLLYVVMNVYFAILF